VKVSLLVASFCRTHQFERSLESILPQLREGDEIVVADDSPSPEGMLPLLESLGVDFQYKFLNNQGYRGSAFARNAALKMTKNELLVFSDPEAYHLTPCIEQIRGHFDRKKRLIVNAGRVRFCGDAGNNFNLAVIIKEYQSPLVAGVMREEMMAIGGWDERFIFWGSEDNDMMGRLGRNGVVHISNRNMEVVHLWHPRPPMEAIGDANESLMCEKDKPIVANQGKEWGMG